MAKSKSQPAKESEARIKWKSRSSKPLKTYSARLERASDPDLLAGLRAAWDKLLSAVEKDDVTPDWDTIYLFYWPDSGDIRAHVGQRCTDQLRLPDAPRGVMVRVSFDELEAAYDELPSECDDAKAFLRGHKSLEDRVWKAAKAAARDRSVLRRLKRVGEERPLVIWTFCGDSEEGARPLRIPGVKKASRRNMSQRQRTVDTLERLNPYPGTAMIGFSSSGDVVTIGLSNSKVKDADLDVLADTPFLRKLSLMSTKITDAGLKHVATAGGLQELCLTMTKISDAGLRSVGKLDQLVSLELSWCKLDGSGLKHLKGLHNLRVLQLRGTSVTDTRIAELTKMPSLQALGLAKAKALTEKCLPHLAKLTSLRQLDLFGMRLTDRGIALIEKMTFLKKLGIGETGIDDDQMKTLRRAFKKNVLSEEQLDLSHGPNPKARAARVAPTKKSRR